MTAPRGARRTRERRTAHRQATITRRHARTQEKPVPRTRKTTAAAALAAVTALLITGCESSAQVASRNNAEAADNFEINRRIIFYNVEHDTYEKVIEGRCSLSPQPDQNQLEVICKTGENEYKKHFQGQAQDFTYFVEQLDSNVASAYHYRVIVRPQTIIPAPELDWAN